MTAPMTREERQAVLIEAAGGPEAFRAYTEAQAALRRFAAFVPRSLGLDLGDIYKGATLRLAEALLAENERRRS